MPHESTVDHDGSELSADDEADIPMAAALEASTASYLRSLVSPTKVPHLTHVRPETPKEVTHHHDEDDDYDDDVDDADSGDGIVIVDENVNGNVVVVTN